MRGLGPWNEVNLIDFGHPATVGHMMRSQIAHMKLHLTGARHQPSTAVRTVPLTEPATDAKLFERVFRRFVAKTSTFQIFENMLLMSVIAKPYSAH